jgi:hypothetical protein
MLRIPEHLGEARWHSNMEFHLGINRRAAVRYLRAMAARHPASVARHLTTAAGLYDQVLAKLETANTSEEAMMSEAGRERLAQLSEAMAALESRAADELGKALVAIRG